MSPAWFSMATFSPASTTRARTLRSTLTVFSMWPSMRNRAGAVRGASQHTAHDTRPDGARRAHHARELLFGRPLRLVEEGRGGTDREHADLHFDAQFLGVRANLFEVFFFQAPQEADLAEMDHLDAPLRAEVEVLDGRPALRAETVQVEAEFDLAGRGRRTRAPAGEGRGASGQQRPAAHHTVLTSGWTHGLRYGRRNRRLASSSPMTMPFCASQASVRPSCIERFARMQHDEEM